MQGDLLEGVPLLTPREIGDACAKQCHGPTSGEDLVEAAKLHGYVGHDDRCFGHVFRSLVRQNKLKVIRSDLPRKRGHGTTGGKLYGGVQ